MMRITLLLLITFSTAHAASEIEKAYRAKRHDIIALKFRANPKARYTVIEQYMISKSLQNMRFFREDIKLNVNLINQQFRKEHRNLLRTIKNKSTVNGDKFKKLHKELYWNIFQDYYELLLGYSKQTAAMDKDYKHFLMFQKILSELEHKESEADKAGDKVLAHITYLNDSIYRFTASWDLKYISWQRGGELTYTPDQTKTSLIITNRGYCLGGDVGLENNFYHYYVDGCLLLGSGGVQSYGGSATTPGYQQANVPAYGVKLGPGASIIVSSTKSRIGLRIPIVYTVQSLSKPSAAGYEVSEGAVTGIFGALYSRWHFGKWYVQTEFGQNVISQENLWSLGLGKTF